ncbi:protein FAM43B [Rhinatrema bivittatum]|uniref:protein FAM43B n=1 Tax=Rhinatrema bivittatum TaxID=194408 RepID=UPI00112A8B27|nr:protein FAM43B [Rhinatrema bivittatum]
MPTRTWLPGSGPTAAMSLLPWKRRSKFVLVEEKKKAAAAVKSPAKSLRPGLAYTSLLASFLRSCPGLLLPPERSLRRLLGGVFRSRRRSVELNREEPAYTVRYLGSVVTLQAKGEGCTEEAVRKIWARSEQAGAGGGGSSRGSKMRLSLGAAAGLLRLSPCGRSASADPGHAYLLRRITHCGAQAAGRQPQPRLFAWVYRHPLRNKAVVLRCHAALLPRAEQAQALARLLRQAASAAFRDFRRLKGREDARRLRRQRLGFAAGPLHLPRRPWLDAKGPGRPPGAPRLCCILEEEDEDEEEEEEGDRQPGHPPGQLQALTRELRRCSLQKDLLQAEDGTPVPVTL